VLNGRDPKHRITILECSSGRPDALRGALPEAGFQVVTCDTPEILLESLLQCPPHVLLYELGGECRLDLGVLRLVRRSFPRLPLILHAEDSSLHLQRLTHEFRPIYFLVGPVERAELTELIQQVLRAAERRMASAPPVLPREGSSA
jgi:DNA-binding NtrC family response regulator